MKYTLYLTCIIGLCTISVDAVEGIQQPAQQESFCKRMCTNLASCVASPAALKQTVVATFFLCATESGIGLPYEDMEHMVYIPIVISSIGGVIFYRTIKNLEPIPWKYMVSIGALASSGAWLGSKVSMDLGVEPKIASFYGLGLSWVGTFVGGVWAKWQHDQERLRQAQELEQPLLV